MNNIKNMTDFLTVAAAVPAVAIADVASNVKAITDLAIKADGKGVDIVVFPEMSLTGYTCADLFHNSELIESAKSGLRDLAANTSHLQCLIVVGLPLMVNYTLYNVAAFLYQGRILGFIPKTYLPNYNEFYEKRWWVSAPKDCLTVDLHGQTDIPVTTRLLVRHKGVLIGAEICEDLWTAIPPSSEAALAGAEVILNLSASDALIGKYDYLKNLVVQQSAKCMAGYVYASAGFGESSTDLVFDGIALIADQGKLLCESRRWENYEKMCCSDIDVAAIRRDRMRMGSFHDCQSRHNVTGYHIVNTTQVFEGKQQPLFRQISPRPFVPATKQDVDERCDEIINIQSAGLAQRLNVTGTRNLVIGISGGLDSTLALLVAVKAFDRLGLPRKGIHGITMPGFGTTDRTHDNAVTLMDVLGVSQREISIVPAVIQHFNDIGHDIQNHDVTYENSQARQRTLLLMDIANQVGGMVLGTGDLSELALGWATYNGDHMSMYGVNAGVPKTLVKYLVERFANGEANLIKVDEEKTELIESVLGDIVNTPISPELIPADEQGNITQKTEDLVGPYELHDFYLYYTLRFGFSPSQIFERAKIAFNGMYDIATILKWMRIFFKRFFAQQFKRSCLPDGPKVGSVCISPRGDWRMPSDASSKGWLAEIDRLIAENKD